MSSMQVSNDESPRTMRPVAILFFTAVIGVAVLLAATASFAVSPLAPVDAEISVR
ncbi:MAG TPA: hypothetical protein VN112_22040 [Ensifer sp.]|nr:hypothetical protein [Ensifer sp.]